MSLKINAYCGWVYRSRPVSTSLACPLDKGSWLYTGGYLARQAVPAPSHGFQNPKLGWGYSPSDSIGFLPLNIEMSVCAGMHLRIEVRGWGNSSVVECLQDLGFIPSTYLFQIIRLRIPKMTGFFVMTSFNFFNLKYFKLHVCVCSCRLLLFSLCGHLPSAFPSPSFSSTLSIKFLQHVYFIFYFYSFVLILEVQYFSIAQFGFGLLFLLPLLPHC